MRAHAPMVLATAGIVALLAFFPAVAVGAPSAVGSQTATTSSSSVTVNRPAGVAAGDVLVGTVTARVGAAVTITPPSGWTLVRRDTCVLPGTQMTQALYYRVASGSEPGATTWTLSRSESIAAGIAAYRGVEGSPVAHSGSAVQDTRTATAPSLTTPEPQTLVVGSFGRSSNTAVTGPAGAATRYSASSPAASIHAIDLVRPSAGATGPIEATGAASSGCAIGQAVAFAPTDAAPGDTPPTAPTSLRVTGSTQTSISLAWNASSDDLGLSGYGLYRDGTPVGSASSTSTTFSELTCGRSYTLGVDAVDTAGNRSARTSITASTSTCTTPPPPSGGGTTITLTNTYWRCTRPVREYATSGLPLRVVMLYTTNYRPPNGGGAVQLDAGCVGDGTNATDLVLDVRGDGRTYGPGEDAVRVTNALPGASNLQIEGRADCGRRVGSAHADGIQVLGGTNITFRNFEVGNYDAGIATCQGAGGAFFYSMRTQNTRVEGGKYIGCNHSLFAGSSSGHVSGAMFRSGRTDGTDPACVGYAASEPCMGPELNRGVTTSGITCQFWNRTQDRWETR